MVSQDSKGLSCRPNCNAICFFIPLFFKLLKILVSTPKGNISDKKEQTAILLNEQKEIADYLDKKCAEIDTLIEKKTALLEEMESYKKSVIYEYVTGKKVLLRKILLKPYIFDYNTEIWTFPIN